MTGPTVTEVRHLIDALARSTQQDWRAANAKTTGPVTHVDAKAGKARIRLGGTDEEPFLSPWVRYAQVMGALKVHTPPSIGQQMDLHSDNGDFEMGTLHPRTQSEANPSPSEKGDEHVVTFGPWTITLKGDELSIKGPKIVLECDGTSFELTGSGLKMVAPDYDFAKG